MNPWLKTLLVVALVAGAVVVTGTAASADTTDDEVARQYNETMWYFVPVLGQYASEIDRTVAAVEVKPELAARLAELAYRGEYMVYDLEGSTPPGEMARAHELLVFALRQLNEAAQIGSEDPDGAQYMVETYKPVFDGARQEIRAWLTVRMEIGGAGLAPVVVAAGQ